MKIKLNKINLEIKQKFIIKKNFNQVLLIKFKKVKMINFKLNNRNY